MTHVTLTSRVESKIGNEDYELNEKDERRMKKFRQNRTSKVWCKPHPNNNVRTDPDALCLTKKTLKTSRKKGTGMDSPKHEVKGAMGDES